MRKMIKKWGNSLVITFNSEEVKVYDLKEGDFLDFLDIEITKIKTKRK